MWIDATKIYIVALIVLSLALEYLTWAVLVNEPFRLMIGVTLSILSAYLFIIARNEFIHSK